MFTYVNHFHHLPPYGLLEEGDFFRKYVKFLSLNMFGYVRKGCYIP
ncbi:hypothetical protein HNQ41_000324 [Texcoconibacillus texcoconensis]|uniref:Uncharacterized protein n=1 Tax=Texcoconibacillus texcoconensis TaxID=1095777 RepID=A0A840QLD7_9BACI|nr:hypothetical protein [Texcoconibacillus texcoconensis]